MCEVFIDFIFQLATDLRYAAADIEDDHERGSLNALATALETMAGYQRVVGTDGVA